MTSIAAASRMETSKKEKILLYSEQVWSLQRHRGELGPCSGAGDGQALPLEVGDRGSLLPGARQQHGSCWNEQEKDASAAQNIKIKMSSFHLGWAKHFKLMQTRPPGTARAEHTACFFLFIWFFFCFKFHLLVKQL